MSPQGYQFLGATNAMDCTMPYRKAGKPDERIVSEWHWKETREEERGGYLARKQRAGHHRTPELRMTHVTHHKTPQEIDLS
jgi:hypothetical protein